MAGVFEPLEVFVGSIDFVEKVLGQGGGSVGVVAAFEEEDGDEGDTISCDECGADLKVVGTDPLEVESAEDEEEEEGEEDFAEEDEEEEESEEDWK